MVSRGEGYVAHWVWWDITFFFVWSLIGCSIPEQF